MTKTITFRPSRIGCPSIPATMKGMIMSIRGVEDAKIHYEERSVEVTFDDAQTNEGAIIKKIGEEMGLALEAVKPGAAGGNIADTCPM